MKRKNIIKITAGIFAVSALLFSFTGCTGNKSGSSSEPDSKPESQASEVSEESVPGEVKSDLTIKEAVPGHNYENIKLLQKAGERLYVFEQLSETVEKEVSSEISVSEKKVSSKSLKAAKYDYVQFAAVNEKKTALSYCDENYLQHLCTIDRETGEITADIEIPSENYISFLKNDGDKLFTAININYTETGQVIHFNWFDGNDLKTVRDENLTEKLDIPETAVVVDAVASPDGSLYVMTVDYKMNFTTECTLHRIDAEGNVSYDNVTPEEWKGTFVGMYFDGNGNLCLCNTEDYSQFYVYKLNNETGELIKEHKIADIPKHSNFINTLSLPGYDFTFLGPAGIYGVSFDTEKTETVVSFGEDLDSSLKSAFIASSFGDTIYMYNSSAEESGSMVTAAGADGKEIFSTELKAERGYASAYCVSPEGTVVYAETYDPGTGAETVSGTNSAYLFHVMDSNGNMKSNFSVAELEKLNDSTIVSMRFGDDGNIYMLFYDHSKGYPVPYIYVSDLEGNFKGMFDGEKEQVAIGALTETSEGLAAVCADSDGNSIFMSFDLASKKLKEKYRMKPADGATFIPGRGKYPVYYVKESKICGYDPASETETALADTSSLGIEIMDVTVLSDTEFLCSTYDSETGTSSACYLKAE